MKKQTFLFDNLKGEDKFKVHTAIVNTLFEKIKSLQSDDDSVNIGLFAEWGKGKSFIVDKLEQRLQIEGIRVFKFDAWKFNGKALERSILFELEDQGFKKNKKNYYYEGKTLEQKLNSKILIDSSLKVDAEAIKSSFNGLFKNIIKVLAVSLIAKLAMPLIKEIPIKFISELLESGFNALFNVAILLGVPALLIKALEGSLDDFLKKLILQKEDVKEYQAPSFSSEEFSTIFKNMVIEILKQGKSNENKKIVIVFDNIDRCEPKYAYEVISTIKTYMDLKECIYLIPCDDQALKQFLKQSNNLESNSYRDYEKEFIDKFFQVTLRIPRLANENLDEFINNCLDEIDIDNMISEEKVIIRQILYFAYQGQTPRQIKRFLNDYSMYYDVARSIDKNKEFILEDVATFTIMVAIKQLWPEFESYLVNDNECREKIYNNDEAYINKINEEFEESLLNFLIRVRSKFNNKNSLYSYVYMLDLDDENEIIDNIRNGKEIEANPLNCQVIRNVIAQALDKHENVYIFNILDCLFKSIKLEVGSNVEDLKDEFNNFIEEIINSMNRELNLVDFYKKISIEDFYIFEKIRFTEKSTEYIQNNLLEYLNQATDEERDNILKYVLTSNVFFSGKVISDTYTLFHVKGNIDKFYNIFNKSNFSRFSELPIAFYKQAFTQAINETSSIDMFNEKLLLFNGFYGKENLIKEYIGESNWRNVQISSSNINSYPNEFLNIGIAITKIIEEINDELTIEFLRNVINGCNSTNVSNKDIVIIYFALIAQTCDENMFNDNYNRMIISNIDYKRFVVLILDMFGEDYFIKYIYKNDIQTKYLMGEKISVLVERLSENAVINNFNILGADPIFESEIIPLWNKIYNASNKKTLLTSRFKQAINDSYDESSNEDWHEELGLVYRFLKEKSCIEFSLLKECRFKIKNLYVRYPQHLDQFIIDCIKESIIESDEIVFILNKIKEDIVKGISIKGYSSVFEMLKLTNWSNDLIKNSVFEIIEKLVQPGQGNDEKETLLKYIEVYILKCGDGELKQFIKDEYPDRYEELISVFDQVAVTNTK